MGSDPMMVLLTISLVIVSIVAAIRECSHMRRTKEQVPDKKDYWFDSNSCFSCGSTKLATELRDGARVLYCEDCGLINASIGDK